MNHDAFDFLATLLKQRSGLSLTIDKGYLLESRLLPLARARNLKTLEDLVGEIRTRREESLIVDVAEAMTTNESSFFRDQNPFDQFRTILLPQLLTTNAATRKIRIWSAASSSGQEAYSLAMICAEQSAKLTGWTVEIVGTDLSRQMVEKAKTGIYTQFEVQRGLPITLLVKHFKEAPGGWQINENLRKMVRFQTGNLLTHLGVNGFFDLVYCRNVLIYFDTPTKARVLKTISAVVPPQGFLILGGAETVMGVSDIFKPVKDMRGLYMLANGPSKTFVSSQIAVV